MSQVLTGISSIPISAASASYAPTNTGEVGNMIDSAVSGLASTADLLAYLATSSIGVDSASAITSIAGSSIAGGGVTGDYVPTSASNVGIGSNITAVITAFAQGYKVSANTLSFAQGGYGVSADTVSFAQGQSDVSARQCSFAQGSSTTAEYESFAQGRTANAISCSFAQGLRVSASATAAVFGSFNLDGQGSGASGVALAFGDGTALTARHNLFEFRKDGTLTLYSSTADTTGLEVRSALNDKLDSSASSSFITSTAGLATTGDLSAYQPTSSMGAYQTTAGMSAYASTSDLSAKLDSSAIQYVSASADATASGVVYIVTGTGAQ